MTYNVFGGTLNLTQSINQPVAKDSRLQNQVIGFILADRIHRCCLIDVMLVCFHLIIIMTYNRYVNRFHVE